MQLQEVFTGKEWRGDICPQLSISVMPGSKKTGLISSTSSSTQIIVLKSKEELVQTIEALQQALALYP